MIELQKSGKNPVKYLKEECDIMNWEWIDEFQSRRSLSLLSMHKTANWIQHTALKQCRKINAFIKQENI